MTAAATRDAEPDDQMPMRKVTADEEYVLDTHLRREDIALTRSWWEIQEHLPPNITDEELIQFVKGADYDVGKAKKNIINHYRIRITLPEVFENRDPHNDALQRIWQVVNIWVSPLPTPAGYRILYNGLRSYEADQFDLIQATKAYFMVLEANLLERGSCAGYILVTDFNGACLGHMFRCKLSAVKRICEYAQDGLQIKIISVHCINIGVTANTIVNLAKPFLKSELLQIVRFYPVNQLETNHFYNTIPREVLPSDLGGQLQTKQELARDSQEMLSRQRNWFMPGEKEANTLACECK